MSNVLSRVAKAIRKPVPAPTPAPVEVRHTLAIGSQRELYAAHALNALTAHAIQGQALDARKAAAIAHDAKVLADALVKEMST